MKDLDTLYIFVTSERPDQYLNPIVYSIIKEGVNRIIFVQIENSGTQQYQLNLLRKNVIDLIQNLSEGLYKYYTDDNNLKGRVVCLDSCYTAQEFTQLKALYIPCLTDNIIWDIKRIKYLDLKKYMGQENKKTKGRLLFDITSVSKEYIGDIIACCLLENISDLRHFKLSDKPNYNEPWKSLIHELQEGNKNGGYEYLNIIETAIFKEGAKAILIRNTPLVISIVGTIFLVALGLFLTFTTSNNSVFMQPISIVGTMLSIISFILIYFPIRR